MLWQILRGHRSAWWFPLLSACCFAEFDTYVISHVWVNCFGSFILQSMFLGLQVFAFEGQNMTFTVKMFTILAFYIATPGPAVIRAVCKCSHGYHICLRRSFISRKLYACLERFLCFLQLYDRTHVSGALCIGLLTVQITYLLSAFVWMKVDFISGLVIVERAFYPRNDFILFQSFN